MSAASATAAPTNVCPQCGAQFRCGMAAGDHECWCARLPPLLPLPALSDPAAPASCLCPDCLKARLI
ncbi:MAG: cysteine-rich CWC family protein [Sulfuritalea sp.]|nr:cysteine-rich CWC family protein [Sulfuritalea sp.]